MTNFFDQLVVNWMKSVYYVAIRYKGCVKREKWMILCLVNANKIISWSYKTLSSRQGGPNFLKLCADCGNNWSVKTINTV